MAITTVLPFTPRHVTTDQGDCLRISLPSRKRWPTIIPAGFFVVVWFAVTLPLVLFAGTALVRGLLAHPASLADSGFLIVFGLVWLSFWTFGGLTAFFTVLWNVAGREVIEVSSLSIRLSRRMSGWGRAQEYLAEHIHDVRVSPQVMLEWWVRPSAWPWLSPSAGQLAFDYGARTIRFGDADEAEAKMILAEIQQRFPYYRPRSSLS